MHSYLYAYELQYYNKVKIPYVLIIFFSSCKNQIDY